MSKDSTPSSQPGDEWAGTLGHWQRRRRSLVVLAVAGCVALFAWTRYLANLPTAPVQLAVDATGNVVLEQVPLAGQEALSKHLGKALLSVSRVPPAVATPGTTGAAEATNAAVPIEPACVHHWPRWQPSDRERQAQVACQQALSQALSQAVAQVPTRAQTQTQAWAASSPNPDSLGEAHIQLQFADGSSALVQVRPRGWSQLGWVYWPLAGLALVLYLLGCVIVLSRPTARNGLYLVGAAAQCGNLMVVASHWPSGLGWATALLPYEAPLRIGFDLATSVTVLSSVVLQPRVGPKPAWLLPLSWTLCLGLFLAACLGRLPGAWWWTQGACALIGVAALAWSAAALRRQAHPLLRVWRQLILAVTVVWLVVSLAVAVSASLPVSAAGTATLCSLLWTLFAGSTLMFTPFLSRSQALVREFALLAGVSTVATSLDLLFVALFSLGPFESLALAVLLALGAYTPIRQWLLNHLLPSQNLTTERTFEQVYIAARALRGQPQRYPEQATQLLQTLFEPLEHLSLTRAMGQTQTAGNGAVLLVPLVPSRPTGRSARQAPHSGFVATGPGNDPGTSPLDSTLPFEGERSQTSPMGLPGHSGRHGTTHGGKRSNTQGHLGFACEPNAAVALRFADRGRRLFTPEDARLADRVMQHLRQAVALDAAVERARSDERLRIAQDLHDDIGARLLTLMYRAETLQMEEYVRHTLKDLKTLTRGLAAREHPLSLAAAEWRTDAELRLQPARVVLDWSASLEQDVQLSVAQWSALTRMLRELISNVIAHAKASQVRVELMLTQGEFCLRVCDDGQGSAPQNWAHGLGLGGVRKRAKQLGGRVSWHPNPAPQRGICCEVIIPHLSRKAPAHDLYPPALGADAATGLPGKLSSDRSSDRFKGLSGSPSEVRAGVPSSRALPLSNPIHKR